MTVDLDGDFSLDTPRSRRRQWAAALIVLVWAQGVLPSLIRSLTTSKHQVSLTMQSVASESGLTARADRFLTYGEMVCSLAILVIFGRGARLSRVAGLVLLLLPWVYLIVRDDFNGNPPDKRLLAYPLVVLAVWALRPALTDLRPLAYLVAGTAVISVLMGFFLPSAGILQDASNAGAAVEDKQVFSQGILLGPFSQGNQLGSYLVIGIASLGLIRTRPLRWFSIAVTVYALLWASSRSSLVTLAVLAFTVVLLNAVAQRTRAALGVCLVVVVALITCATPVLTNDPEAFTNRGFIWAQVLKAWNGDPVFGLGTDWFAKTAASSGAIANSAYDAHNQLLQLLTTGGIALAAVVGLMLVAATVAAAARARAGQLFGLYFMTALLGAGWLEASFGFVDRNQVTAVAIVPLAFLLFAEAPVPREQDLDDETGVAGSTPRSPSALTGTAA